MNELIHILYLDDDPLDRERVRAVLEDEDGGFQVVEAVARAAIEEHLATGRFDLVLSDLNIPGFQGLHVIDAVRLLQSARARQARLPVAILTGAGSEEMAVEAMKRGAADYILKRPDHIRRLPATLRAVLARVAAEEARRLQQSDGADAARMRAMVENSGDVIARLNAEGRLLYASPTAERLWGYPPNDYGADTFTLVHPDDPPPGWRVALGRKHRPQPAPSDPGPGATGATDHR